jgi:hypothetical protein
MLVCPISTETWGSNKVGRAMGARCWRGGGRDSGGERRARGRPSHQSGCSGSCVPVAIGEQAVAEDDAAASITLSLFGGDADDPNSALIFDRKAMPAALADGLPRRSPLRALRPPERVAFRLMTFSRTSSTFRNPPTRGHSRRSPFSSSPPRSPASSCSATFCGPATTFLGRRPAI